MCGIVGYIDLLNAGRVEEHVLQRMADALIHRGPDSRGYFVDPNAGIGTRRLRIIDLETGDQPLFNEDRSLVLSCNGEIFNYRELRKDLETQGHSFRTKTDVEVLVHLYEEDGVGFLNKLNAQFAFAIYNRNERSLFLARDQFGICPLFHTTVDGFFIFASEIKAILEHPSVPREVNLTGLDQVLSLPGAISPQTLFRNIHSLPSGHYLVVRNNDVTVREYWDLDYPLASESKDGRPEAYYAETLRDRLEQSVRYRLQADVPVGFFLSGGLDSSLIAAMIRRVSPDVQRHSFSISFADERLCEAKYQRLLSNSVASIHHEIPFNDADIALRLKDAVYHSECPLKETYNTASLALSRETKRTGVTVVLNGEGSDELFAGYVGYRFDKARNGGSKTYDLETLLGDEMREKFWGDKDFYYEKDEYPFRETKQALYAPAVSARLTEFECSNFPVINKERLRGRHVLHKRSYLDFKLRLGHHLIADHGDRMTMANSVEARYPFLDINLVEFCKEIPPDLKLNGLTEKYILKKAAEDLIPQQIVDREKFGFVAPGSPALLQQKIDWVYDLLSYDRIKKQGYFNPDTVEFLKKKYSQKDFKLNLTLEDDLLIVVITFGLFLDLFRLPSLN
ncbi:MAG TPA: asparagine synthase (glutamine-hydrolyzing) [Pyrinomonadaceae bacterium]|nr:asparagine synthase (glutamine-hydrolyzing) [Pyrinomonadaceae bacterium]